MKIVLLQSYSSKIYDLTNLTLSNHFKYANTNGYSLIFNDEQYTGTINFTYIAQLLQHYDVVFTYGSDIIFTNFNIKIESFIDDQHYLTVSKESDFSNFFGTPVNGEILIFNRYDDGIFKFLVILNDIQENIAKTKRFGFKDQDGVQHNCSTQGILCMIYKDMLTNCEQLKKYIKFYDAGILQAYIQKYVKIRIHDNEIWNKDKFLTHVFGIPNDQKFKHIQEFLAENKSLT